MAADLICSYLGSESRPYHHTHVLDHNNTSSVVIFGKLFKGHIMVYLNYMEATVLDLHEYSPSREVLD